jgi:Ca2+-binding EF-hand superfamily protein
MMISTAAVDTDRKRPASCLSVHPSSSSSPYHDGNNGSHTAVVVPSVPEEESHPPRQSVQDQDHEVEPEPQGGEVVAAATAATTATTPPKKAKKCLNVNSKARDICAAFFVSMDLDGNGFIEENEVKVISMVAFQEDEDAAQRRWHSMLRDMDENQDCKISQDEYIKWWIAHTQDKIQQPDGETFVQGYASYLLQSLLRITSVKTANDIIGAFFQAMDANEDGYLVEEEIKQISKWAFGAKEDRAQSTWLEMKEKMDTNGDNKISKEEYSDYWMKKTRGKIQSDGTFAAGYRRYLLSKLVKLKAGKKRQEQVEVWKGNYGDAEQDDSNPNENSNGGGVENTTSETSTTTGVGNEGNNGELKSSSSLLEKKTDRDSIGSVEPSDESPRRKQKRTSFVEETVLTKE